MLLDPLRKSIQKQWNRAVLAGTDSLTRPVKGYGAGEVTNLVKLKSRLKPGDVVLVSGNARISYVVKVLTLSQWSHVVLYVGDRRDLITPREREQWERKYGPECLKHLVVDADPLRGVHLKPVDDFVGLMLRQCRPDALSAEDISQVIRYALSQQGRPYDVKHIIRLLFFYAFPWELFPAGVKRTVNEFTLSESDTICSRVLSEAFQSVGYPIRPLWGIENRRSTSNRAASFLSGLRHRGRSAGRLLAGGRMKKAFHRLGDTRYLEARLKGTRYITPADYDLSRFFSIVKDRSDLSINYQSIREVAPLEDGD